jgi:predicted Fe-Mo cluster-binding NifX family protein
MKIAVTAATKQPAGMMDDRFGRAPYFLVFDSRKKTWTAYENSMNSDLSHGSGIQAAQALETLGAKVLITGSIEPLELPALRANSTKVYCVEIGKVSDVLAAFFEGHYEEYFASSEK